MVQPTSSPGTSELAVQLADEVDADIIMDNLIEAIGGVTGPSGTDVASRLAALEASQAMHQKDLAATMDRLQTFFARITGTPTEVRAVKPGQAEPETIIARLAEVEAGHRRLEAFVKATLTRMEGMMPTVAGAHARYGTPIEWPSAASRVQTLMTGETGEKDKAPALPSYASAVAATKATKAKPAAKGREVPQPKAQEATRLKETQQTKLAEIHNLLVLASPKGTTEEGPKAGQSKGATKANPKVDLPKAKPKAAPKATEERPKPPAAAAVKKATVTEEWQEPKKPARGKGTDGAPQKTQPPKEATTKAAAKPKTYAAFPKDELVRVMVGLSPKPTRHLTAVYTVGIRANKVGTIKRVLAGNCGISLSQVPNISFIGKAIAEFHVYVDYVDTFREKMSEALDGVTFIDLDPLDPALIKNEAAIDKFRVASQMLLKRLEKRVTETPTAAHRRFLKAELQRARSQMEAGVFIPRETVEEEDAMEEDLLIDLGAAAAAAVIERAQAKTAIEEDLLSR